MNEKDLVSGCQQGDNSSRRHLYDSYAQHMMGICYRYTGDVRTSEDLLHDGFIKIFEAIHSFQYRSEGSLKAWMSKIFTNLSLEYLRKNSLRDTFPLDEYPEEALVDTEYDFDRVPPAVLMQFVAELPAGYRTVFNLNTFEEMSHKEIANRLHINESSSRSQLARAKATLSEKVKNYTRQHE
ncbi:MAG: RNA polymerase sigma factor [Candidatus Symbiothrix sp.]|jgi:RNA polymerase sigma-70 factor (ECF subfamily)|nr:RNA polymerase sigma factor [Candidatus Symbiothrix sp.]